MLPIVLDSAKLRVGLAGRGEAHARRLRALGAAGVEPAAVHDPSAVAVAALDVLFVAGLGRAASHAFAEAARAAGVLVNVEDMPELCDFHLPASVRRGDLLITVSTGGTAPGLARALRERLERLFDAEWDGRTGEVARLRETWRARGLTPQQVSERIRSHLVEKGWLA